MINIKKLISFSTALLILFSCVSCGQEKSESTSKYKIIYSDDYQLNDRQKNNLEGMKLATNFSELSTSQKRSIQRIEQMLCYLEEKYGEEFIYKGYVEPGINQSEALFAYSLSDQKKRTVTVKFDSNGDLTDDYQSRSVSDYCEGLIDDWIHSYLGTDDYRYYSTVNACHIEMYEIENDNFQWEYGASNIIFIKMQEYDFDELEKFAVNYAKFLYDHQISGTHRIHIMRDWPDYEVNQNNCGDWYKEVEYRGFYDLGFIDKHTTVITASCRIEVDYRGRADYYDRTEKDYSIDEYFSKY